MRLNPENPEFPEDLDEESPAAMEPEDARREVVEHELDDLEVLSQHRALGADDADDGDAVEQVREVAVDDEDYRE
ncbi:hypothetical protein [Kitasatospora terrestris]|uniref:DUF5709 domain-containing protein n=1 Tax=Kitasatospora terrestris TaxID=258051 RepID=A0ABP9DPJ7_9ACTN